MSTLTRRLALLAALLGTAGFALATGGDHDDEHHGPRLSRQVRHLYVATIAQSAADPDFVAVVAADPRRKDFGRIVNRIDMPHVGNELHHFGYSFDQNRLIVPGLFSNRIHVFDIPGVPRRPAQ
jgi:hypothetical protein